MRAQYCWSLTNESAAWLYSLLAGVAAVSTLSPQTFRLPPELLLSQSGLVVFCSPLVVAQHLKDQTGPLGKERISGPRVNRSTS